MSEPVTSEDFQALIEELKKTNKQLSQQKASGFDISGFSKTITKKLDAAKDSITSPFRKIKDTIAAPGKFIGDTVENIGDAVMTPFKSFKNVSEGFKNIFSKNQTERQTKLLEQILESINGLDQSISVDANREQNQDLIKLEQGKEQKGIFRSISDNIKNAGVSAGGRGSRRKGKGGASGGGDRGFFANMAQDFFLAAIVTQRGIGEFVSDIKKNVVDTFKAVAKPFKKVFSGVKKVGKGAMNLTKDVFGKDKGQKGIPFRRAIVKEKVSSAVSSVTDKVEGLKDKFFPKIPKQIEAQPEPGGFDTSSLFSEDIIESNHAIVEAVKENTSSLIKVLTGNDLKKAETEKERDKTFQNIADSLEDIEGSGLGKGAENKKGEGLISKIIDEYGGAAATIFGGKKLLGTKLGAGLREKSKGLFSKLNPFSKSKAPTGAPSPRVSKPALPGPVKTVVDAGKAGQGAAQNTIKNITNAPGSSVVGAPKPKGLSRFIPKKLRRAGTLIAGTAGLAKDKISNVAGLAKDKISSISPMQKIKDAAAPIAKKFPSLLKRVPVLGGVVEGIFLNSEIKRILADPEASEDEKKDAVGTEFIKALTGPAGAAIAIGAVTAATGGVGFLASAVTGTAGYAIGNVVGGIMASVLPTKTIGGAIIDTFYKKESAQGQTKTQNSVKTVATEAKAKVNPIKDLVTNLSPEQKDRVASGARVSSVISQEQRNMIMDKMARSTSSTARGGAIKKFDLFAKAQLAKESVAKAPNTTGGEMLGAMKQSSDATADMNTRMNESRNPSSNTSVVNAPTNSNVTTINEAPNHVDRTTTMFGGMLFTY